MKKAISMLLTIGLLVSSATMTFADAPQTHTETITAPVLMANGTPYAVEGGNIYYSISNGEASITDADDAITYANIPATINGAKVTSIGYCAFWCCAQLENVTLPQTLTSIGDRAFDYCPALKSIDIP